MANPPCPQPPFAAATAAYDTPQPQPHAPPTGSAKGSFLLHPTIRVEHSLVSCDPQTDTQLQLHISSRPSSHAHMCTDADKKRSAELYPAISDSKHDVQYVHHAGTVPRGTAAGSCARPHTNCEWALHATLATTFLSAYVPTCPIFPSCRPPQAYELGPLPPVSTPCAAPSAIDVLLPTNFQNAPAGEFLTGFCEDFSFQSNTFLVCFAAAVEVPLAHIFAFLFACPYCQVLHDGAPAGAFHLATRNHSNAASTRIQQPLAIHGF